LNLNQADAEAALALWQLAASVLGDDCKTPEDLPRRATEIQRESLSAVEQRGAAHREAERLKVCSSISLSASPSRVSAPSLSAITKIVAELAYVVSPVSLR
jgi:hypothetical protein